MTGRPTAAVLALSLLVVAGTQAHAQGPPSDAEVAQAIVRGVAYLKGQQGPGGNWTYSFNHDHALGITALAGLALMENGVDRSDPVITRAGHVVHELAPRSDQTYDVALAILFLARVQGGSRGPDDALIRRLARRLAAGEQGGMWSYNVPVERAEDDRPPRRSMRGLFATGDNSNTQFALLGIWAAGRHGFDANDALEAIDGHFRKSIGPDGHWGYNVGSGGTSSMTCAGLIGLAISAARPRLAERQTARARGAALAADPVFSAGLKAVSLDARQIGAGSDIYYIWSLERVCVALGLRDLDGFDWYAAGARELLRRQLEDGSWNQAPWDRLPSTCLALLFLRKANLAFELDRVLKLPGADRPAPRDVTPAEPKAAPPEARPVPRGPGDGEYDVVVTGASDARFPEITVDFEVRRPDGTFLVDAKRDDFRVTEEDRPVSILRFESPVATVAHATTVVLVVDRSRSMEEEDRIGSLKRAVGSFVEGLPRGSRVAVVAFGSDVKTICPFTGDARQVRDAVEALTPEGATRYYDAVAEALEMLASQPGRRAVLALTDGEDTFSQTATLDSVVVAARRLGLPVHTLGLGTEDEIESGALRRLAVETRGQYYPARQADQLRTIYEQLAERLRSSYSLAYQTDRKLPDGTLRPVRVYYRASRKAGETAVFIPGMVVPAGGWPGLFVLLVGALAALAALPGWRSRRRAARTRP